MSYNFYNTGNILSLNQSAEIYIVDALKTLSSHIEHNTPESLFLVKEAVGRMRKNLSVIYNTYSKIDITFELKEIMSALNTLIKFSQLNNLYNSLYCYLEIYRRVLNLLVGEDISTQDLETEISTQDL